MNRTKNLIILALLINMLAGFSQNTCNKAFAIDNQYSNQLLKLNLEKTQNGSVDIKVYSSKPYKIKLTPIKRSDNEYVILLPETYHSITARPDTSNCNDSVQDIDVKLVPYIGSQTNNGITKITIRTKNPDVKFNISNETPDQAQTLNNELSRVILAASSKANTIPKTVAKKNPVAKAVSAPPKAKPKNILIHKPTIKTAYIQEIPVIKAKKHQIIQINKPVNNDKAAILPPKPIITEKPVEKQLTASNPVTPKPVQIQPVQNTIPKPNNVLPAKPVVNQQVAQYSQESPIKKYGFIFMILAGLLGLSKMLKSFRKNSAMTASKRESVQYAEQMKSEDILSRLSQKPPTRPTKETISQKTTIVSNLSEDEYSFSPQNTQIFTETSVYESDEEEYIGHVPDLYENIYYERESYEPDYYEESYQEESYVNEIEQSSHKPPTPVSANIPAPTPSISLIENEPEVIDSIEIGDRKSLYLVKSENKNALIGIINSEIFMLNTFNHINKPRLIVKKTDKVGNKDLFVVQIDNWKGLVSVQQDQINLELTL